MKINGEFLLKNRVEACMTRAQLSEGICTSEMIRQIEHNEALPSDELVYKIADRLNVPVAALIRNE